MTESESPVAQLFPAALSRRTSEPPATQQVVAPLRSSAVCRATAARVGDHGIRGARPVDSQASDTPAVREAHRLARPRRCLFRAPHPRDLLPRASRCDVAEPHRTPPSTPPSKGSSKLQDAVDARCAYTATRSAASLFPLHRSLRVARARRCTTNAPRGWAPDALAGTGVAVHTPSVSIACRRPWCLDASPASSEQIPSFSRHPWRCNRTGP